MAELKESWKPLLEQFKIEVNDKSEEVDPENDHCWLSLTIGWAIAKGVNPEEANEFANYVRYSTDMA